MTTMQKIRRPRREHKRWQLCGPGRTELRHVTVRATHARVLVGASANYELALPMQAVRPGRNPEETDDA